MRVSEGRSEAHLVVYDLQEVVGVARVEFILYVGGYGKLCSRRDGAADAEPQTFSLPLNPVYGPQVPQTPPCSV